MRGAEIETLLGRQEWTLSLVDGVGKGALAISELPGSARLRLQLHGSEAVKLRHAHVVPPTRADRAAVLARYRGVETGGVIRTGGGGLSQELRGLRIAFGPDLVAVRGRPVADFLVAILDPNAAVEPRSVAFNVEVIDGRGSEVISRTSIRRLKAPAVSPMPEGFAMVLARQAMADLRAWINERTD